MKNVLDKVRPKDKARVKRMLREVFDAPDYQTAWERLQRYGRDVENYISKPVLSSSKRNTRIH